MLHRPIETTGIIGMWLKLTEAKKQVSSMRVSRGVFDV